MQIREVSSQDMANITNLIFDIWMNEYQFDVKKEDYPDLQSDPPIAEIGSV